MVILFANILHLFGYINFSTPFCFNMKGDGSWKVPEFSVEFKVNVNESGDLHSVSIRPQFYEGDSSLKEDLGTHVNKIKVSLTNRKNRIEKFTMGRSRLGQNFHG